MEGMNPPSTRLRWCWPLVIAASLSGCWAPHHAHHRHARVAEVPLGAPTAVPATATPSPAPLPSASGAQLAIIIDDAGQWPRTEQALIALPVPLTLSVLPDVRYTQLISNEATAAGKGVMLHLPMEPYSKLNPGPGKITTTMSDAQIAAQVAADLADVPLAQGVNNHEGSKATADPRVMRDVASAIAKHGNLFFIDSMTTPKSVAEQAARAAGVPAARRDVFLDNQADTTYTESQLFQAAAIARLHGSAIAIGHPRPTTLAALRAVIPKLEAQGIRFVLVRDLVEAGTQPGRAGGGPR